MRTSLACYAIRLRPKRSKDEFLPLEDFGGNDFFAVFNDYLADRHREPSHDSRNQRILRVLQFRPQIQARQTSGAIEFGHHGYEAELYDVDQQQVSYTRSPSEAELSQYYFLISLPCGLERGALILQRKGRYGIRTALMDDFVKYLRNLHPTVKLEINPLIPDELLDQYLNRSRIVKYRLLRSQPQSDIADAYYSGRSREKPVKLELHVSPPRGLSEGFGIPRLLHDIAGRRRPVSALSELVDIEFSFDSAKVELEIDGRRKVLDLSAPMPLRAYYDISETVISNASGIPQLDSVDNAARSLMRDILGKWGVDQVAQ